MDRRARPDWWRWYKTPLWQARRSAQLQSKPLCERCERRGRITAASVVHHNPPHRGDWQLFSEGPLESLCKPCHDSEAQREGKSGQIVGCDISGLPVDPKHHWRG